MTSLFSTKTGFRGSIQKLIGREDLVKRLMELGFVVGEEVSTTQVLLGGEPLVVKIQNAQFALRRHEAECIMVAAHLDSPNSDDKKTDSK